VGKGESVMTIHLCIEAIDSAVESVLSAAACTGLDGECQIDLLRISMAESRWLEAAAVAGQYVMTTEDRCRIDFQLGDTAAPLA
jgi:hypothetical protein